jgi:hypothetical protein
VKRGETKKTMCQSGGTADWYLENTAIPKYFSCILKSPNLQSQKLVYLV